MPSYKTAFNGYSVKYSPFESNKLAVATAQHFGIVGNGRQYILNVETGGGELAPEQQSIQKLNQFDTQDGLYDCCWNEENENQVCSVSGDGSVKIWDLSTLENPIRDSQEHSKEVYSVDWNLTNKDTFLTGSWDHSIKLWSSTSTGSGGGGSSENYGGETFSSLETFDEHKYCVYGVAWKPSSSDVFASVSGDHSIKIWSSDELSSVLTIASGHGGYEILTCDWNKYNEHVLVTGSVDKSIKIWDVRNPDRELNQLRGHTYAVRRLKCSPHDESIIASCSYDMTLCVWDSSETEDALIERYEHHTEFVVGLDFNLENEDELASCSWDETVYVWMRGEEPVATHDEGDEDEEGDAEDDAFKRSFKATLGLTSGAGGGGGGNGEDYDEEEEDYDEDDEDEGEYDEDDEDDDEDDIEDL